jgi:hypothetical protein
MKSENKRIFKLGCIWAACVALYVLCASLVFVVHVSALACAACIAVCVVSAIVGIKAGFDVTPRSCS